MAITASIGTSRFRIAIPSYKRAETLLNKTLRVLQKYEVRSDLIDVFVATEAERKEYRRVLGPDIRLVVGVVGINKQREFIHDYYEEGQRILCIDDDVSALKSVYTVPFDVLVDAFFDFAESRGCRLWGVHPNDHGLQLADRAVLGLSFIIGSFFGMCNWRGSSYPNPTTEDFTRSILAYEMDGAVVRFDGVGPTTRYFSEPGGLQEYRTAARQDREMRELVATWPEHVRLRRRVGRMTDVQFKRRVRVAVISPFGA